MDGQHIPRGKPWDRQPVSGKLRRKLGVSPGLAAHSAHLPQKRLGTRFGLEPFVTGRYDAQSGTVNAAMGECMRKSRQVFWLVVFSGACLAQSANPPAAEPLQALRDRAAKGDVMAERELRSEEHTSELKSPM